MFKRQKEEDRRGGPVHPEHELRRDRDQRGRDQRSRPKDQQREPGIAADLAEVERDRVAEQHQHQAERGEHAQRG